MLAQFVTAGVALPLYYSLYLATTGRADSCPRPEYAWTAILSTVLGMLGLSIVMDETKWSYTSVAAWQAFPVYMLLLNVILPPLLRRVVDPTSRPKAPVIIMTIISTIVSVREHTGLLFGPTPIKDALLPPFRGQSLGKAGHALFAVDLAFAGLTIASIIALRLHSRGVSLTKAAALVLTTTMLLGPGAAHDAALGMD